MSKDGLGELDAEINWNDEELATINQGTTEGATEGKGAVDTSGAEDELKMSRKAKAVSALAATPSKAKKATGGMADALPGGSPKPVASFGTIGEHRKSVYGK